jgi:UDPglucose--hexose-1-phosphate uridylyltransferase
MAVEDIQKVIFAWQNEYNMLEANPNINYVQIFENKGAVMGCSNPHPHGQIWSQSTLPNEAIKKDKQQYKYFSKNNRSLLEDYIAQELNINERIIFKNESFVVLVPFWAIWPFEAMIIPKLAQKNISALSSVESYEFAEAISVLTKAYDKLFNCSFPYSSGIHQAPTNGEDNNHWHWHMSFYPPLLRSATVKKFMVGYEMFGSPQRDITAEIATQRLKKLI